MMKLRSSLLAILMPTLASADEVLLNWREDTGAWIGKRLTTVPGQYLTFDVNGVPTVAAFTGGLGDVVGPAGASSGTLPLFLGSTGKLITTSSYTPGALLSRANHSGTQAAATITGLATVATSGSATDLSTGSLPDAQLSANIPRLASANTFTAAIQTVSNANIPALVVNATGGTNKAAAFAAGSGASIISFDASGNFGIGSATKANVTANPGGGGETYRLWIEGATGNIGMGNTAPSQKLDVTGTVKATSFSGDGSALTGIVTGPASSTDSNLVVFNGATGKIIKESSVALATLRSATTAFTGGNLPAAQLPTSVPLLTSTNTFTAIRNTFSNGSIPSVVVSSTAVGGKAGALIAGGTLAGYTFDETGDFGISTAPNATILTNAGGAGTYRLFMTGSNGFISLGNGTTAATERLDVNGNVKATSFIGSGASLTGITRTGVRRTQYVGAGAMLPRTTAGAAPATVELVTNDIMQQSQDFDQTIEEGVGFWVTLPSAWNLGTLTAKVHWTAAAGAGTVKWDVSARTFADDDAMDQVLGTEQTTGADTLLLIGDMHITPTTPALTVAGVAAANRPIYFQIARDVATDTLTGDARLLGVTIEYTESATEPVAQ
jgi:hypothetical protein